MTVDKLYTLLSQYQFEEDTQEGLRAAFNELDNDADGFISKKDMTTYLKTLGEGLSDEELTEFYKVAID